MERKTLVLLALGVALLMLPASLRPPRGLRNNNPGNIRHNPANQWQGMAGTDRDGFVIFEAPEWGIRAIKRTLDSYRRRGIVTLQGVITTWAPDTENNTRAYIADVSQRLGVPPTHIVTADDQPALIAAIIRHENGVNPFSLADIQQGIALA